jgi:hypothetical protein
METKTAPALTLTSTRGSISAQVLYDYLTDPAPVDTEVPWRPEAITAAWLTEVVRRREPGAEVTGIEVVGGTDGTSSRRMLEVAYAGEHGGLPNRFLAKATPTLAHRLAFVRYAGNEATFYSEVRPELDLELPTSVFAAIDPATGRSLILLDDLTETVAADFCTWEHTLTKEQVLDAVTVLGALHRRYSHSDEAGRSSSIAGVGPVEEYYGDTWIRSVAESHEKAMELAADEIPDDIMARRSEIIPLALRGSEIHRAAGGTLLHSDPHLGNWYITGAGRMGLCDWQGLTRGHWSRDFAYSTSTLMTTEQRREWYAEVRDRYLEELGPETSGVTDSDEADVLIRQQMCNALLMWSATLVHPSWVPDMQPDAMSIAMIQRITAAMSDSAALDSYEG